MTQAELTLAILALLLTPGPTNTLMFLAGAEQSAARAARLIPAELAGYLVTVGPLALMGAPLIATLPQIRDAIALVAGLWVAMLAWKLWQLPLGNGRAATVTARSVFLTTLLNPKALILGLVLLPDPQRTLANLANFSGQVALVAVIWAFAGATLGRAGGKPSPNLPILRRAASVWLAGLAVAMVLRASGLA